MRLHLGRAIEVLRVSTAVAGTFTQRFVLDEGALGATLVVRAVTGSVTASIAAEAGRDELDTLITWPVQTSADGPLSRQASTALANHVVTVTTTGAAEVSVWAKPLAAADPVATANRDFPLTVQIGGASVAPMGRAAVAQATPHLQLALTNHADDRIWDKYEVLGGTVTAATTGEVALTTSTTAYSYAALLSAARLSYRPGQGAVIKGTAAFSAGGANTTQVFGPLQAEEGVAVGMNGTAFGFLHRIGRRLAIYKLDLTVGAGGAETVTITLNGTAQTVAVTAGTTTQNAREIAQRVGGYADAAATWNVQAVGATVYFTRTYHGVTAGAFTLTSTGTCAGSFTQIQAGANGTSNWTPQASFSHDPLNGYGPSGMLLDPTKLNLYEFRFGWLGSLAPELWVFDRQGLPHLAHRLDWTNRYAYPWCADPKFTVTYAAGSDGGTTSCTVRGASCAGELFGPQTLASAPQWSVSARKTSVGATEIPIITVQCARVNTALNRHNRRAVLLDQIHLSNTSTKDVVFKIYKTRTATPTQLTGYAFTAYAATAGSSVLYDTAATAFSTTSTYLLRTLSLNTNSDLTDNLDELRIEPGECLIVTAATPSATTDVVVSLHGFEDA